MSSFRYMAVASDGSPAKGTIEAEDRKGALQLLGKRGIFPSILEPVIGRETKASPNRAANGKPAAAGKTSVPAVGKQSPNPGPSGGRIRRKDITTFTREMGALLGAAIPIPQALEGLGEEEENPALRELLLKISNEVRTGVSFSAALDAHPKLFTKLYVSMVRVGEEAGQLPRVMADLAELLEHEDEVRSEVRAAISYPLFVLVFGLFTVFILLTVVLPKLFTMLEEMLDILPLPTLILLKASGFLSRFWLPLIVAVIAIVVWARWYLKSAKGAEMWDRVKLKLPVMGGVYRAGALSRFARTLGTLVKSGVSLLPALKIVEHTIGNIVLAKLLAQVAEETRGGDSLAAPLRKVGIFSKSVIQMINVGEETGKLDEMLLKVADIEERHMRAKTKTMISLLAPALILVVGALVGFMVIALLLPIFKMSRGIH